MENVCRLHDLKKAYPKDSYPLPRIDQLVEVTSRHEFLSFMDAYSEYNQIKMAERNVCHTAFYVDSDIYHNTVMPFSLINASATYQRMVSKLFFRDDKYEYEEHEEDKGKCKTIILVTI